MAGLRPCQTIDFSDRVLSVLKDRSLRMDAKQKLLPLIGDTWKSENPLPDKDALGEMVERLSREWNCPGLARRVKIDYNPRLTTTLGRAVFNEMRVELNPRLLRDNPDELAPTLAHELAHLVVHMRYERAAPHGREFKTLMRAVNFSGKATHNLPVSHLRRRQTKYLYLHRCEECDYQFVARSVRRQYYCLACGPKMKWDIFRVPNTSAGLKLLDHLRQQI